MRLWPVVVPFFLVGCTSVEVVRIAPPETLVSPHETPRLSGDDNESLVRLAEEMEAEIDLCNAHKQLIREFYEAD